MADNTKTNRKQPANDKWVFVAFVLLALAYSVFKWRIPLHDDPAIQYGLSPDSVRLLRITTVMPLIGIWFLAFYGYYRLKNYTRLIGKSRDGRALSTVAGGLFVLAISLPISSLTALGVSYMSSLSSGLLPGLIVARVYLDIAISLLAFVLINKGARGLLETVRPRYSLWTERIFMVGFFVLGIVYTYLMLTHPAREFSASRAGLTAGFLSDILLVITVIAPYLYTWFLGFGAAYSLELYRHSVKGSVYKQALGYLASGLALVIAAKIAIRMLDAFPSAFGNDALRLVLGLTYGLLVLAALGFSFITVGTRKLKKIEEV